ncbi:MAG TPA: tryptophan synthase subunit beta, partial [Anaeromyxobacteraceae bacterium]|nr:tryptophan synthase subunit beta [Anaeromyxobacteraceae bacterium]
PALESAHAVAAARKLARRLGRKGLLLLNISGRGDKDVEQVRRALSAGGTASRGARRPSPALWARSR